MLAWKGSFNSSVYSNKKIQATSNQAEWLTLDSLEKQAIQSLKMHSSQHPEHAEKVEIRPSKGIITFQFKNYYYVQIDGTSGNVIMIEKRWGGIIQDIHDGAIIDGFISNKNGLAKKIYTVLMGLVLLTFTITGFYLWFKPNQIKKAKGV